MRLATLETADGMRPVGVTEDDQYVDLTRADETLPRCLKALLGEKNGIKRAQAAMKTGLEKDLFAQGTLRAPIRQPGKVIGIGLNYSDHAAESGMDVPPEPVCFSKFANTIIGPDETIQLPAVSQKVDYEAELVVVIGRRGRNIAESEALNFVAGYTNGNDVSARDWQIGKPGGQWLLGKTPDTFAPIGPWLVTADEISNPNDLGIALRLNGETMQDSSTEKFIFKVEQVIAYLSQLITLEPGDVIFTGTPPGVGMARKPPIFLKPGDVVEVETQGLGVLSNPVRSVSA